jgi:hypothetical protein
MNRTVMYTLVAIVILSAVMCLVPFIGDFDEGQTITIVTILTVAVIVCVAVMLYSLLKTRKTVVELGVSEFRVRGIMVDISIPYNDVKSMELRNEIAWGLRTFGADFGRYVGGTFNNKEFGSYKISLQCNIKKLIIVRHLQGTLVFNQASEEATIMMYESIKKRSKNVVDDSR